MKMLPTSSARWNPDVIACDAGIPAASWSFVRLVETAVKMASPGAPPSHCDALSSGLFPVVAVTVAHGRITALDFVLDPTKLARVTV
jgi:hypothetical protein